MTDVDLVTMSMFSLYPFHSSDSILWWNYVFFFFFLVRNMGKSTLEMYYSKVGGAAAAGMVGGGDVLIERPTPREARTSKFIDFRISHENTSAS